MTEKVLEIEGLRELVALISNAKNLQDQFYWPIHDAIAQSTKLLEAQIKQNLSDNDSVGLGDLRGSVSSEVEITQTAIVAQVGAGRGLSYAEYLESGTGPAAGHAAYTPPLSITKPGQPLYEWVRVKHITGVYSLKNKKRLGAKAKQVDETQKVARAVWANIRKKGTRAHPYFFKALEQKRAEIDRLFSEAVNKLVSQIKDS